MKSKTILAAISWTGNEHIDNPTTLEIELTPHDILLIQKCQKLLKENKEISDLRIDCYVTQFFDEVDDNIDFSSDVNKLVISISGIHYFGQHKYDSTAQLESEDITNMLFKEVGKPNLKRKTFK